MAIPVALDIQTGVNIDDIFSLALALCSSEIDLVLVSTVSDADGKGTRLAQELVRAFGSHVPVVRGSHKRYRDETRRVPEAIDRLIEVAQEHSGELVLVTNGPLTNIALAIRESEAFQGSIKQMITMAGWTGQRLPEWNVQSDPEAMRVILGTSFPLFLFSRDVTTACRLNELYLQALQECLAPGTQLLLEYLAEWQKDNPGTPTLHDPLTIAYLCNPELAAMEDARIDLIQERTDDQVLALGKEGRAAKVCRHVNTLSYFNMIIERLTGAKGSVHEGPSEWTWIHTTPPPLLYNALELEYKPGWHLEPQTRSEHQLVMVRRGSLSVSLTEASYTLEAGDLFYIPAEHRFSFETSSATGLTFVYFKFSGLGVDAASTTEHWIDRLQSTAFQISDEYVVPAERVIRELVRAHLEQTVRSTLESKALLYELLSLLYCSLRQVDQEHLTSQQIEYVESARRWITERVDRSFSLEELARAIGVSKYHLARLFARRYSMSPGQYHTRLRMQNAKSLIELGHLSISEVGYHLGYRSVHSFSRAFKAYWGVSPTEYASRRVKALRAP